MSAQASSDLIWRVVKGNNAFLVKQRAGRGAERTSLSHESNNVAAKSSFKFSGLAHASAGLALTTEGQIKVVRGAKSFTVAANKPGKAKRVATNGRKDLRTVCSAHHHTTPHHTTTGGQGSVQEAPAPEHPQVPQVVGEGERPVSSPPSRVSLRHASLSPDHPPLFPPPCFGPPVRSELTGCGLSVRMRAHATSFPGPSPPFFLRRQSYLVP